MKKKKEIKDYYLKQRLRFKFMWAVIPIILGVYIIYFTGNDIKIKKEFMKNANKAEATITNIKYNSEIEEDEIKEVYVKYIINNKVYTGSLQEKSSTMYIGRKIDIYYDINDPSHFIQNNKFTDNLFYYIGWFSLVLGIFMILDPGNKLYIYLYTLNGREIKANIEEIIKKENHVGKIYNRVVDFLNSINYNGVKEERINYKSYKIKCSWTDEYGTQYIFYSRKFNEPYFIKEFKKMDLKELTVRFKNKRKYIVITEEIDKILML